MSAASKTELLRAKRVLAQERSALFFKLLKRDGISEPETEWKFHPVRHWRFDFAWPQKKLALEVEGGVWTNGRHNRGQGFVNDMSKYNSAALLGWRVLRTTPTRLTDLETIAMIKASITPLPEPKQ